MKKTKSRVRCGLCDVYVDDWKKHEESEQHKSKLRVHFPSGKALKKYVENLKYQLTKAEKRKNWGKVAKAENLGYYSEENGRSYYKMRCQCGKVERVFAWRGCKRCSNCGRTLHTMLSFSEEMTDGQA